MLQLLRQVAGLTKIIRRAGENQPVRSPNNRPEIVAVFLLLVTT